MKAFNGDQISHGPGRGEDETTLEGTSDVDVLCSFMSSKLVH